MRRIKLAVWLAYGALRGRAVEIETNAGGETMRFVGLIREAKPESPA